MQRAHADAHLRVLHTAELESVLESVRVEEVRLGVLELGHAQRKDRNNESDNGHIGKIVGRREVLPAPLAVQLRVARWSAAHSFATEAQRGGTWMSSERKCSSAPISTTSSRAGITRSSEVM